MDKLLFNLKKAGADTLEDRKARFRCVVTLIFRDGKKFVYDGSLEGHISFSKAGCGGFGYDPVFIPTDDELSAETDLRKRLLRPYSRLSVCRTRELSPYFVEWRRMNSACCLLFLVIVPRHWMHLLRQALTCLCAVLRSPAVVP